MTSFTELSFELGPLDPEAAEAACFACGAASVTFVDSRDDPILEPLPGEFRLWPATRMQALFVSVETEHFGTVIERSAQHPHSAHPCPGCRGPRLGA